MKKITTRVAVVAVLATALVAGMVTNATAAGTNATQDNGSDGPLYIWNGAASALITSGAWTDSAITSSSKSVSSATLTCPAGSEEAKAFISARGNERRVIESAANAGDGWKASTGAAFASGTKNVNGANIRLSGLTTGTIAAVQAAGGNYSLGIACVSGGGTVVDKVYYRYIAVTATSGAWTAAASDYSYPTPTLTYTQLQANATHSPAYATPHIGDTINAVIDAAAIPDGFNVAYQWYAGGNAVSSNGTSASYVTVDNDAGKTFTVTATYSRSSYNDVVKTSVASLSVEGTSVVSGGVTVNAEVVAATNGQLALDVQTNASTTLTGVRATSGANNNKSVSTGSLPNLTVNDGRVVTLDGWDLTAKLTDFTKGSDVIGRTQLGIAPAIASRPTDGNAVASAARAVGDAFTGTNSDEYKLASSAKITGATTDKTYVGATVVNGTLTLVAPQWKPAGTYTATMTVTVVSK